LVMTSRGCPNRCTYCCERNLKELFGPRHYRRRSVQNVMEELVAMKRKYDFREVMFYDAVFAMDKNWLKEFLAEYSRRIGVKYRCLGHVRFMDDEVAGLLRGSGCYNIEFGLQTINERVRFEVLNRMDGNREHLQAFEACDRAGLRYDINHMFGLPGESEPDFVEAAEVYARLKMLNRVKVFYLTYFPMLRINEIAKERGMIDEQRIRDFEEGKRTGSYFHSNATREARQLEMHKRFAALYKIIPLLSPKRVQWLLARPDRLNRLGRLPFPIVVLLQILAAIRGRDYRFLLMMKYSAEKLYRAVMVKRGCIALS
jgi:anaerobic magnesium-protoporphyrin IX monomethyl ester cyclase